MTREALDPIRAPINEIMDVVTARRRGLEMGLAMGFPTPEATKIAVVISELGRNILLYAETGMITVLAYPEDRYITIIAQDQGPGIEDVDRVLEGGYTTSRGLGMGISGSKRLMDEFVVQSVVGAGTMITAVKRLRRIWTRP